MLTRARAARFLTDFDSSVNSVRALGNFLRGKGHRAMSVGPGGRFLPDMVATSLSDRMRAAMFRAAGFAQGIPLHQVRHLNVDELDEWAVRQYRGGPYPVVAIGSGSGALVHLAAALGAPFLPQTTLSSVRDLATEPDDAVGAMSALAPTLRLVARNNPRVAVYHLHDPAQDRPMLESMAYLRLKRRRLGPVYERFLTDQLAPGGTILQVECTRDWRTRKVGDRAYFQFGCLGGVSEEEYHDSGDRIANYLAQEDSPVRRWQPPEMDARRPEAEWGWDPALGDDIADLADQHGFQVQRMVAPEPQDFSAFVAELYRWWYGQLGRPADRLLVESYVQWDPHWMLRTGSVPFWLRFNLQPSFQELADYLASTPSYEEIYLNLFSQGIESPGVVPVQQWEELVRQHARSRAEVVGVDRDTYPLDAGSTLRYQRAFKSIPVREPVPAPLDISEVGRFLRHSVARYPVTWATEPVAVIARGT